MLILRPKHLAALVLASALALTAVKATLSQQVNDFFRLCDPTDYPWRIHYAMPWEGDGDSQTAADTWTAVGTKLSYLYEGLTSLHPEDNYLQYMTIAPDIYNRVGSSTIHSLAEARRERDLQRKCGGKYSAILVNDELMFEEFSFGPTVATNKFDYRTVILHEMGHIAAVEHETYTDAVMYQSLRKGEARRKLHWTDVAAIKYLYQD
jgi:hypothetical protein